MLRELDAGVYFVPPAVRQAWWCSKLIHTATPSHATRGLIPAKRMIRATRAGGGKLTRTPTRGVAVPLERTCGGGCGGVGGTSHGGGGADPRLCTIVSIGVLDLTLFLALGGPDCL
jgi:hypothetical protein